MRRVGLLALIQESNTFLHGETTLQHFQNELLLTGDAIRQHFCQSHHEIRGFLDGLQQAQVPAVPLFAARAMPFGTIRREVFEQLVDQMLSTLKAAGPLDGLLVAPHGATVADGYPDTDGAWLTRLRATVGSALPIIGTLDPHGNLSGSMVAATDALTAYRTNPHIDQEQRGLEAADLMVRTLRGEIRPTQAACFLPMAINIERQCTTEPPCSEVVACFDEVRTLPGVLSATLMLGFPYADVPQMGSATLVVTDGRPDLAQELANRLGREVWNRRQGLAGTFLTVETAVERAAKLPGPVCLLDMGDNVGGGSPGDGTWIAHELLRTGAGPAFVCLDDADSVRQAEAIGAGNRGAFQIGGRSDELHGPPLCAEFRVERLLDGRFTESEVRHGGITDYDQGRIAILSHPSGLTVMLTSRRTPPFSLRQLTAFGIEPEHFQILVAKGVNAPLAAYQVVCPSLLRVNTLGCTVADMTQLSYRHRRRPMFPFEPDTHWS